MIALSFKSSFDGLSNRDARGRFVRREINNAQVRATNERLAVELQDHVVRALDASIVRRSVSSRRLHRVTADRQNLYFAGNVNSSIAWGVGVESYLDNSQAKYWRTIEEGSLATWKHPFAGTQIWPWVNFDRVGKSRQLAWGGTLRSSAESGYGRSAYMAGPPWGAANGKFRGIRAWYGRRYMNKTMRGRTLKSLGYGPITVKREITPHYYYERGFEAMGGEMRILRTYQQILDGLTGGLTGGGNRR